MPASFPRGWDEFVRCTPLRKSNITGIRLTATSLLQFSRIEALKMREKQLRFAQRNPQMGF
jgi:hypothetical protein